MTTNVLPHTGMEKKMKQREIIFQQLLCVLPTCAVSLMVGITRTWVAPILSQANDPHAELPLNTQQCSWIAALSGVTQCLCPAVFFFLVDRVGRRPVIILNATLSLCVWMIVYWSRCVLLHYIARLIGGFYSGVQYMVASIYVCENCSPELRGTFATINVLSRYAGHTIVFLLATYCTYNQSAVIYCLLALLTLLSTVLLTRETPQYLLMTGNTAKARINFARLRDMEDTNAQGEFEAMKENIEQESERGLSLAEMYHSREVFRSLCIVIIVPTLFTGAGWVAVNSFMSKVFSSPDRNGLSPNELSMYCSLFHLLSVGISSTFIDKINRRSLLMSSSALKGGILAGIALLYYIHRVHAISCFQLVLFILFSIFSCLETGLLYPLMNLMVGELLPQSVKRVGAGLSMSVSSVVFFVNNLTFLPIAEAFGMEMNFVTYLIGVVLMTVYAYYTVPETRGKTLVEIQNELKGVKRRGLV